MNSSSHPEEQYLNLLQEILSHGKKQVDEGTGVVTWSLFGRQARYDLSQGFPLLTTKRVYWKGVLHELYWFMSGQTNIKYLVDQGVHIWDDYPYKMYRERMERGEVEKMAKEEFIGRIEKDDTFAEEYGDLTRCYGEMWRRWPATDGRTVDQLRWAIEEVRRDPSCHNALVTSWHPEFLYGMAGENRALRFPICHNLYQIGVQEGRLSLHLYQRSADMFLGVPFNIASYALLTHVIAKVAGYKPGDFVHTFGDLHIYENHIAQVKEQLSREPKPFPTVTISDEVREIDDFRPEHVTLEEYAPHPTIKAALTPAGGLSTKNWKTYAEETGKA